MHLIMVSTMLDIGSGRRQICIHVIVILHFHYIIIVLPSFIITSSPSLLASTYIVSSLLHIATYILSCLLQHRKSHNLEQVPLRMQQQNKNISINPPTIENTTIRIILVLATFM